jgi:hypothetical protein
MFNGSNVQTAFTLATVVTVATIDAGVQMFNGSNVQMATELITGLVDAGVQMFNGSNVQTKTSFIGENLMQVFKCSTGQMFKLKLEFF